MEKRVLLAVVLSAIVLFGYQALYPPPPKPTEAPGAAAPQSATTPAQPPAAGAPGQPPTAETPAEVQPGAAPVVADTAERDVAFENESVSAVFTTRGGALKSWRLKKYQGADRQPLELVPSNVPPGTIRPFTLSVPDAAISKTLAQALYKPTESVDPATSARTITFEYQDASALSARKAFTFSPNSPYLIVLTAEVKQSDRELAPTIHGGAGIGTGVAVQSTGLYNPPSQPIFYRDGKVHRVRDSDIPANAVQDGAIGFGGVDDHYFLAATIPGGQPLHVEFRPLHVPIPGSEKPAQFVEWSARYPGTPRNTRWFFGPKDFDVLAAVDRDLVRSIDFGMFAWLVVPLLRALKWVNVYVGNYGWSIIILTVLINVAMFPLRHKSVVSMRRMQEIQPEIKGIQDRYANLKMTDPARQKMNTEMMALYRERGVNPASGCVPMLLTLPVLFAFYAMLSVAIELRGAPFVGWIHDLSVHDPLFITPVLMGVTQFIQTRMTPSTADPTQQRMMMFMPLIFMTMFIWAPAGLVLYWTTSNVWAIGQQVLTNRLIGPAQQRTVRPPAERRVKTVGGGKTNQAAKERK